MNSMVSGGCLEGVCRVSGWSLDGVWGLLNIAKGVIMSEQVTKSQLLSFYSAAALSPSGL